MVKPNIPQERIEEFCRRWKVREFALFGSILRDDFGPESDVDVMVDFAAEDTPSLLDHVAMQEELADLLARRVDLVTRRAVEESRNPIWRRAVLRRRAVSRRDRDLSHLLDLLNAVRSALHWMDGVEYDSFAEDVLRQSAVAHQLEIIHDAAERLSGAFREANPAASWTCIDEIPDVVCRDRRRVDVPELWRVSMEVLPALIPGLERIAAAGSEEITQ